MSQRDYYEFMGYSSAILAERYAPYADRFPAGARVIDVGCGRGEFLELLAQRGVAGLGIDADADMVAAVKEKGLEAIQTDAGDYLSAHPGEFDGIFAAHVIEHLRPDELERLVKAAADALRQSGRLLVVTPNPHNLSMHLNEFWTDLQHVRFYTPEAVRWLLHQAGLGDIEVGENPLYRSGPEVPAIDPPASPHAGPWDETPKRRLRLRARARQRLAEWLTPASLLERMQRTEDRVTLLEARSDRQDERMRTIAQLREVIEGFFPPAEFYVTGTR